MYTGIPVTQEDRRSILGHLVLSEAGLGCFLPACWFFCRSQCIQDNDFLAFLLAFYKTEGFHHLQTYLAVSDPLGGF